MNFSLLSLVLYRDYIQPKPKPAAPIKNPSTPPNLTLALGFAAPVNIGIELAGGAAEVPVEPLVVVDGVPGIEYGGELTGVLLSSGGTSDVESAALLERGALDSKGDGVKEERREGEGVLEEGAGVSLSLLGGSGVSLLGSGDGVSL